MNGRQSLSHKYRYDKDLLMPFTMMNILVSFQSIIDKIIKNMIILCLIAYIDDIFIYSQTKKDFKRLLKDILRYLYRLN
jgi:hypothetical protein